MNVQEFKHFKKQQDLYTLLDEQTKEYKITGSRTICDPPPLDTDEDYVCLVEEGEEAKFEEFGFHMNTDTSLYTDCPEFYAYRKGVFNLVVTSSKRFFDKFIEATYEARAMNIMDKTERIRFFQEKLYGRKPFFNEEIPF